MKSKVLVIFTAVLLFGVGFVVYSYNSTPTSAETVSASFCSCCGDSCPMKSADATSTGECCCKGGGDSCPMKSTDAKVTMSADAKDSCPMMSEKHEDMAGHDMKTADGESCPLMRNSRTNEMHTGMKTADGKSGYSCSCCNHNKENKDTTEKGAI